MSTWGKKVRFSSKFSTSLSQNSVCSIVDTQYILAEMYEWTLPISLLLSICGHVVLHCTMYITAQHYITLTIVYHQFILQTITTLSQFPACMSLSGRSLSSDVLFSNFSFFHSFWNECKCIRLVLQDGAFWKPVWNFKIRVYDLEMTYITNVLFATNRS